MSDKSKFLTGSLNLKVTVPSSLMLTVTVGGVVSRTAVSPPLPDVLPD